MTVTHTYNWFDAWGVDTPRKMRCTGDAKTDAQIPCDDQGHGTHTVGTMLGDATEMGDTVLGMAPDATWVGCRNMTSGVGTPASYTACFEFFLAPYPQGGNPLTDGKPEMAPHIVNNSWGCPPSEGCDITSLRQIVETVRAFGIFVVASAGNNGNICGSVRDPISIHDATFTIGAHANSGNIASFSSIGPVTVDGSNRRKPDIAAPGVDVRSAGLAGGVNTFLQGTSMASPHVAGAVALLWSAVPTLTGNIDLTEQVLIKSAVPVQSAQCSGFTATVTPNNVYGYGNLDVLDAVQCAQQSAALQLTILSPDNTPKPDAVISLRDDYTGSVITATSGISGHVAFPALYVRTLPDTFSVTAVVDGITLECPKLLEMGRSQRLTLILKSQSCTIESATALIRIVDYGDKPIAGATVTLASTTTDDRAIRITDANGYTSAAGIAVGEYTVTTAAPRFHFDPPPPTTMSAEGSTLVTQRGVPNLLLPLIISP
jgi:subtilisin family serine protease